MKKYGSFIISFMGVLFFMTSIEAVSNLSSPVLRINTGRTQTTLSWDTVPGAEKYTLFFAPYPEATYIENIDIGNLTTISFATDLIKNLAFYVAVKAVTGKNESEFSNIEVIQVPEYKFGWEQWVDDLIAAVQNNIPDDLTVEQKITELHTDTGQLIDFANNFSDVSEKNERLEQEGAYLISKLPELHNKLDPDQKFFFWLNLQYEMQRINDDTGVNIFPVNFPQRPEDRRWTLKEWTKIHKNFHDYDQDGVHNSMDSDKDEDDIHDDQDIFTNPLGIPDRFIAYDIFLMENVNETDHYEGWVSADSPIPSFSSIEEAVTYQESIVYGKPIADLNPVESEICDVCYDSEDCDMDGLSNEAEMAGWTVMTYDGDNIPTSVAVTSDPCSMDTDGDNISDSVEWMLKSHPGNNWTNIRLKPKQSRAVLKTTANTGRDSDNDGLPDMDELKYGTDPNSADTDEDCKGRWFAQYGTKIYTYNNCSTNFYDGYELQPAQGSPQQPSNPAKSDTDGDSLWDREEYVNSSEPKFADMPSVQVLLNSDPSLTILDDISSSHSIMNETLNKTETTKKTAEEYSLSAGFSGLSLNAGFSYKHSTERTTSNTVQKSFQEAESQGQNINGYDLAVQVIVKNLTMSALPVTLNDIRINGVLQTSSGPILMTLSPDDSISIPISGTDSHAFNVSTGTQSSASDAIAIMSAIGKGQPIIFSISYMSLAANYQISASGQDTNISVAAIMNQVYQNSCTIKIDYGPYDPTQPDSTDNLYAKTYYVAPSSIEGISMDEILSLLNLGYQQDSSGQLIQVNGITNNDSGNWEVASSSDDVSTTGTYSSFGDIVLKSTRGTRSSDGILLIFKQDQDNDGLDIREEIAYDSDDTMTDTDADGLTDYDEVRTYTTSPVLASTDGDFYTDYQEVIGSAGHDPNIFDVILDCASATQNYTHKSACAFIDIQGNAHILTMSDQTWNDLGAPTVSLKPSAAVAYNEDNPMVYAIDINNNMYSITFTDSSTDSDWVQSISLLPESPASNLTCSTGTSDNICGFTGAASGLPLRVLISGSSSGTAWKTPGLPSSGMAYNGDWAGTLNCGTETDLCIPGTYDASYVIGNDQKLYVSFETHEIPNSTVTEYGTWLPLADLPSMPTSPLSCSSYNLEYYRSVCAYVGKDGNVYLIYHRSQSPSSSDNSVIVRNLGSPSVEIISNVAVSAYNGTAVFVVGKDNQLYSTQQVEENSPIFSGWASLGTIPPNNSQ